VSSVTTAVFTQMDEEPALVEVHFYRMRVMHDQLNGSGACHEQRGLFFVLGLGSVSLLVLLLLPTFASPMPMLSVVVTLVTHDIATHRTTIAAGALTAVTASVPAAVVSATAACATTFATVVSALATARRTTFATVVSALAAAR
jgi:hypothetical protein